MKEFAAIIKLVLSNTQPAVIQSGANAGKTSRANYVLDDAARAEATERINILLQKFPVYPELDLAFLQEYFG
jgi:glycine hydroxymethyltransferase